MTALHRAILRSASWLVPGRQRADWFAEWRAELCYVTRGATAFCLGAYRDAVWLQRNSPTAPAGRAFGLEPPIRCLSLLAVLAAIIIFFALRLPLAREMMAEQHIVLAYPFMLAVSVLVLSASTSLTLGEYPANRHSPRGAMRPRRWIFFGIKLALLLPIVYCGSLDLAAIISVAFQSHGFLVGSILALRWALVDQRRRCPVCLRRLTSPTRIGEPSHTFLDWYGTELICAQGHGLLYVPEIPSSCYTTQRWQYLDPSWSSLFSYRAPSGN